MEVAMMKKKRLSIAPALRMIQESDNDCEGSPLVKANNDAQERKDRRKSAAIEVAKRDLMLTPHRTPKKATASKLGSQLTDLYANCIKMCTENKINQKNSWSLNLIDYITEVLDVKPGEMTNFQVASCTLDASVKIYSCRVDSVLSDTFKVLGGLNRGDAAAQEENEEKGDEEGGDGDGEGAAKKAKSTRIKTSHVTLEANPANLNVKKFDLEFDIDPLFRKTSAAFDEGGAKGLLLNHLTVHPGGRLLFDSEDTIEATAGPASACSVADIWATFGADLKDIGSRKVSIQQSSHSSLSKAAPPPVLNLDMDVEADDVGFADADDDFGDIFSGQANGADGSSGLEGAGVTADAVFGAAQGSGAPVQGE